MDEEVETVPEERDAVAESGPPRRHHKVQRVLSITNYVNCTMRKIINVDYIVKVVQLKEGLLRVEDLDEDTSEHCTTLIFKDFVEKSKWSE